MTSEEVRILQNAQDWHIHLFIKRKYNDKEKETDFYYLGEIRPIKETIRQLKKLTSEEKEENVVEMEFTLNNPVEANYYEFLTGSEEDND